MPPEQSLGPAISHESLLESLKALNIPSYWRMAIADPRLLPKILSSRDTLVLLSNCGDEVVKAFAAMALAAKETEDACQQLSDAIAVLSHLNLLPDQRKELGMLKYRRRYLRRGLRSHARMKR